MPNDTSDLRSTASDSIMSFKDFKPANTLFMELIQEGPYCLKTRTVDWVEERMDVILGRAFSLLILNTINTLNTINGRWLPIDVGKYL